METKIYDYLQSLLPNDIQLVDPYIDNSPIPNGDWCCMNILKTETIGRSAERQEEFDKENKTLVVCQDINKIYKIQFDFYGKNSFENAETYQQMLQVNIDNNTKTGANLQINLKSLGEIQNLTELLENKKYYRRYSFNIELFTIETIRTKTYYLTDYKLTLNNY